MTVLVGAGVSSNRHAVCIRQDRRGMTIFDVVVLAFFSARVSRQSVSLTELRKASGTSGHNFVNVSLMAGIPQNGISR